MSNKQNLIELHHFGIVAEITEQSSLKPCKQTQNESTVSSRQTNYFVVWVKKPNLGPIAMFVSFISSQVIKTKCPNKAPRGRWNTNRGDIKKNICTHALGSTFFHCHNGLSISVLLFPLGHCLPRLLSRLLDLVTMPFH